MKTMSGVRVGVMVLTGALLVGGCSGASSDASAEHRPAGQVEPTATVHAQRVKEYTSIKELAAESAVVLVGRVASTDPSELHGADVTLVTVDVERVLKGKAVDEVVVREFVTPGVVRADGPPALVVGNRYLLHLVRTEVEGDPDDYFYVTGLAGAFALDGERAVRLDPFSEKLPDELRLAEVAAALAGQSS